MEMEPLARISILYVFDIGPPSGLAFQSGVVFVRGGGFSEVFVTEESIFRLSSDLPDLVVEPTARWSNSSNLTSAKCFFTSLNILYAGMIYTTRPSGWPATT
jgi:hypothetical protein